MGSVLRRVERRARGEDPNDARDELMHRVAALLNAHRVKRLGDDALLTDGLLELAALLAVNAVPAIGESDFKVKAINAHVEATRQQTEEDEEEDGDDE